jgi:Arc/MetJ-type ribon-helix-helix transcriptional regulator
MTIHLPEDVENSINAEVLSGHFATADDALAAAWRAFQQQRGQGSSGKGIPGGQGSIGAMRDAADELDEMMEHVMKRRQQPWRLPAGE